MTSERKGNTSEKGGWSVENRFSSRKGKVNQEKGEGPGGFGEREEGVKPLATSRRKLHYYKGD